MIGPRCILDPRSMVSAPMTQCDADTYGGHPEGGLEAPMRHIESSVHVSPKPTPQTIEAVPDERKPAPARSGLPPTVTPGRARGDNEDVTCTR